MARLRLLCSRKGDDASKPPVHLTKIVDCGPSVPFGSVEVGGAKASCTLRTREVRTGQYYDKPASILFFEFRIQDYAWCRLKAIKFKLNAEALPTSEPRGPFPPEFAEEVFCNISPRPCHTAPAIRAIRQETRQSARATRARQAIHPAPYEAFGGNLERDEDSDVCGKAIWIWQADPWSKQGAQQQILYGAAVIRISEKSMQLSMTIRATPAGWREGNFQPSARCTTVTPVDFGKPHCEDFFQRALDLENKLRRLNGADLVESVEQLNLQREVNKTWSIHPDLHDVKDAAQSCDPSIDNSYTWFYQYGSSYTEEEDDGGVYDYCWAVENDAPVGGSAAGAMWFVQRNNAKVDNRGPATVWDQCWAVYDIGWSGLTTLQEHAAEVELSDEEELDDEENGVNLSISGESDAMIKISAAESCVMQHKEDEPVPPLRPTGSEDDECEDLHRHFAEWEARSPFAPKQMENSWASLPTTQIWEVGLPCWPKRGNSESEATHSMHRAKRMRTAFREITR